METSQTPTTLDDVLLHIFRQHTLLQELTDELEAHATAVLARADVKPLNDALERLNTRFVRHLEYEEAHLARWLVAAEIAGAPLLGDHGDQRARLAGLLHDRDVFSDPRTLAREVLAFVHHLRKDMTDEDAKLRALR